MKYQDKENTDHQFKNGFCVKCGWSKQWAEINGWKCTVSENSHEKSGSESFENEDVDFLNHRFVEGNCEKCGWSYDWARKKAVECPVFESAKDSGKNYNGNQSHQDEKKKYQSSNNLRNNSDAAKYGEKLGLKGKVTIKDIKKNYRELSKKYHPDRVSNLGIEFSEIADKKMKEINEAYDWFKNKYDF